MRDDDSFRLLTREEAGWVLVALLCFALIFWPYLV